MRQREDISIYVIMDIYFKNTDTTPGLVIDVNDDSYRYRAIKGEHNLTLHYSLAQHVEVPVGAWCMFEAERYELEMPSNFKKKNTRNFEYTLIMESVAAKAKKYKFRNPIDRRLMFSLTAKPREHLQMFIDNMNARDSGWTIGECIEAPEKLISYNHAFCIDALTQQADEFETEYEFVGKKVSLHKVEYDKTNPLPLSYGKGNGFKPGIGRANYDDSKPIEVLYVQGGEENIDASKYGSKELLLPKNATLRYDGERFEGEAGFNTAKARTYVSDADGFSLRRSDKQLITGAENSLDCSHISPKRVGNISGVVVVNAASNFYDFIDNTIPADLNYNDCLIAGETMTVIFQSGMLAGKEFEVKYYHEAKTVNGVAKAARRFEIVPQEIDGVTMPNNAFKPVAGQDTYAVFNISLPAAYVCNNGTKSGASWDMFRESVKYLYENEGQKFTFTGELDGAWAKRDWLNIGGRIRLGGYILFSDTQFQQEGVAIRIVGIKDYINKPHSPEIELSNQVIGSSFTSTLGKIEENEVVIEDNRKEILQFTKRRFRDSLETMTALVEAMEANFSNFSNSINPLTVETMMMLVGNKTLQFVFVQNISSVVEVPHNVTYNNVSKQLSIPGGYLQHKTLGIDSISSGHKASEYKTWSMPSYLSAVLTDTGQKYYVYAKVSKTAQTGVFITSPTPVGFEGVNGYYHLLLGILNSEFEGERSYASLHGFTEVLPGQVSTNRVVTSDGNSFLDFLNNALHLGNDSSYLDWNNKVANTLSTINMLLENATIKNKLSVLGEALIAGFYFTDEIIKSTVKSGSNPAMYLNGRTGKFHLQSNQTGGDYSLDYGASSIDLDAGSGDVIARNSNGVAYLSASGVFCNNAKTNAYPASSGYTHYGAIVGVPSGNLSSYWEFDKESTLMAGVYGRAYNSGNAPAYGGYFVDLLAAGLILNPKYVTDSDTSLYLSDRYTQCIGLTNSGKTSTVYLPTGDMEGKVIFAKQIGQGQMRFRARSGQFIFDDISANDYYDIPEGWEAKFTFSVFILNGVRKEAWLVSRFKF